MSHVRPRVLATASLVAASVVAASVVAAPAVAAGRPPAAPLSFVVIGDSIPFNAPWDCPACTGFVEEYAQVLERQTGRVVTVVNRSRHDGAQTKDIQDQVHTDAVLRTQLRGADVVLVSTGFNDLPPYDVNPDAPCFQETVGDYDDQVFIAHAAATAPGCVSRMTSWVRARLHDVLHEVRALAPRAAIGAMDSYDAMNGWAALDAAPPGVGPRAGAVVRAALLAWRPAVCGEVALVRGTCVDVLTAFNGPFDTRHSGDLLGPDYDAHPSQKGNDLIARVLLRSGLGRC